MSKEPDYKTAYETLSRAVDDAFRVIMRAQLLTEYMLQDTEKEPYTEEDLQTIELLKSEDWDGFM